MLKDRIRELRQARGWNQTDLAARAGLRQGTIANLETGARDNPTQDTLDKLARALDVPVSELLGEGDILAGEFPAPTLRELGLTDAYLLRYAQLWPDLNREQRAWVVGHLRIMADAERKIRALEGRAPRGEPDSAPEAGGHLEIIPGCV
jgi:transcriptional regulator with XRE-family HTH domain